MNRITTVVLSAALLLGVAGLAVAQTKTLTGETQTISATVEAINVTTRTLTNAKALADACQGQAVSWDQLDEQLARAGAIHCRRLDAKMGRQPRLRKNVAAPDYRQVWAVSQRGQYGLALGAVESPHHSPGNVSGWISKIL